MGANLQTFKLASGTKALIIPALALWVFQRFNPRKKLGWALFFSWFGDLLFNPRWDSLFYIRNIGILDSTSAVLPFNDSNDWREIFTTVPQEKALLPLIV